MAVNGQSDQVWNASGTNSSGATPGRVSIMSLVFPEDLNRIDNYTTGFHALLVPSLLELNPWIEARGETRDQ